MSKRKSDDNYEKIFKKIKKLEKRLRRRRRSRSLSESSRSSGDRLQEREHETYREEDEIADNNVAELLDAGTEHEVSTYIELDDADATVECVTVPTSAAATATSAEPSTSAITIENIAQVNSSVEPECVEAIPDSMILEILGEDPTISNTYGAEIHKDLAARLEYCTTNGLSKELRKELIDKYLVPSNCKLISAPALNAEIKAAMTEMTIKRDKNIEQRQKQMSTAISCISQGINKIISSSNADPELTKMLMDSERILCDLQYNDSVMRKKFILSSLKKDMRDQLQSTKPDNLLFGQNLSETIKTAKAISKSGADLKTPVTKPQFNNKKPQAPTNTFKNLNWKGPNVGRKQPNHPNTKGPSVNNRPSSSSKQSRHQATTRGRR